MFLKQLNRFITTHSENLHCRSKVHSLVKHTVGYITTNIHPISHSNTHSSCGSHSSQEVHQSLPLCSIQSVLGSGWPQLVSPVSAVPPLTGLERVLSHTHHLSNDCFILLLLPLDFCSNQIQVIIVDISIAWPLAKSKAQCTAQKMIKSVWIYIYTQRLNWNNKNNKKGGGKKHEGFWSHVYQTMCEWAQKAFSK